METAAHIAEFTDAMSDSWVLRRFLTLAFTANFVVWLIVIFLSDWIYAAMSRILTDKIGLLLLGVPFGLGLYITYSVFRWRLPDIEDNKNLDSEIMASFGYQSDSTRRWLVWFFSAVGGVLNVGLLIIANMYFADQL